MPHDRRTDKLRGAMSPRHWPIVGRKLVNRLRPGHRGAAQAWAAARAEPVDEFGTGLAPHLWAEAAEWATQLRETMRARKEAGEVGAVRMGGPGDFQLVYFLTRFLQPRVVLETGVAAGFTSQAILCAIERNATGTLYSSDLPYLGQQGAVEEVGRVVEDRLRANWHLGLGGDRANLAEFLPQIEQVDLVHYDSDKSASGRAFVMESLAEKLSPSSVVVMDDIGDNTFFRDWTQQSGTRARVFHRGGPYYVGLVGL